MNERKTSKVVTNASCRALSVPQVAAEFGISQGLVWKEIKRRRLRSIRFGKRVLIERVALEAYLSQAQVQ